MKKQMMVLIIVGAITATAASAATYATCTKDTDVGGCTNASAVCGTKTVGGKSVDKKCTKVGDTNGYHLAGCDCL